MANESENPSRIHVCFVSSKAEVGGAAEIEGWREGRAFAQLETLVVAHDRNLLQKQIIRSDRPSFAQSCLSCRIAVNAFCYR